MTNNRQKSVSASSPGSSLANVVNEQVREDHNKNQATFARTRNVDEVVTGTLLEPIEPMVSQVMPFPTLRNKMKPPGFGSQIVSTTLGMP
ncbi:hypothetical protein SESBI_32085 [Sesbania bispinosa]|nr:hypothetical protein SESBI_32085 [Sesbania bispinosa]